MRLQHLRADVNLAWPSASVAVRGTDGTRQLIFSAHDSLFPARQPREPSHSAASHAEGLEQAPKIARPLAAAQFGIVDAVIRPAMTRRHLCSELELLQVRVGAWEADAGQRIVGRRIFPCCTLVILPLLVTALRSEHARSLLERCASICTFVLHVPPYEHPYLVIA